MTTAPVRPGPTNANGPDLPTVDQLLNLVARAERKGALDYTEGNRLRSGILHLANQHACDRRQVVEDGELRRKYDNARKNAWRLKRKVAGVKPAGSPAAGPGVDEESREALRRVVEMATRWTHIPAKRQAGASVLAAIRNDDAA